MKLRNKLAAITAAAMLAFAGIGFASWQFTSTVNETVTGGNEVTCAVEASNLTADHTTLYLICDAPTDPTGNLKAGDGIFWSTAADGSAPVTSLTLTGEFNHNAEDLDYECGVSYEFTCTPSGDLAADTDYFTYNAGSFASGATGTSTTFADVTAVYTLPTYSYVAAVKAYNTVSQVTAMNTALNGKTLTLSFTFGII